MRARTAAIAAAALALLPATPAQAVDDDPVEDTMPPVITITPPAGGADGWYGGSTVAVHVRATDNGLNDRGVSRVAYTLTGATTREGTISAVNGGTVEISATGLTTLSVEAVDRAGNDSAASVVIGIDQTRPRVVYSGRVTPGAVFVRGEEVPLLYTCSDAESGLASCVGPVPSGGLLDTSVLGDNRTVQVTATDRVGLQLTHIVHYQVVDPDFDVVSPVEVTGAAQVGHELTGAAPEFSPTPADISYQWHRDGVPIEGATGLTYLLRADDAGHLVTLVATASRPAFHDGTSTSAAQRVVPGELVLDTEPVLTGTPRVGETLEVEHPPVFPGGTTEEYFWFRGSRQIAGASERSYVLRPEDLGQQIRVALTASRSGYLTRTWVTPASAAVAGLSLAVQGTPRVTGSARVGSTLRAVLPSYTSTGGVPVTTGLQWLRDGRVIPGATAASYRPVAADAGRRLGVRVTGSAPGHVPSVLASAATGPVARTTAALRVTPRALGRGRVRLAVAVTAAGVVPTGSVVVRSHGKVVARGVLRAGRVTLKAAGLRAGRARLSVSYAGDAGVAGRSSTIGVRVR